MRRDGRKVLALFWLFSFVAISLHPSEAQAYLDAGTGSLIFQAVLGGLVGALVIVRMRWRSLMARFRKNATEDEKPEMREGL